ncbi:DUF6418 domain-containing protein [Kushneria phyllosphaerae]|uniref:DUF6418 domain-containing protein n=1 Tax=Kushneria phyllosphaerae TaxID=2100822 RepID=A0A2R8CND5_9GAMM|nr:DUF6418 domain-containing protein [Kushneria phyllosphaerae]SPJ34389.1 hypothetical protein KSP9073_02423 [Kushneria phyllosphaerae]
MNISVLPGVLLILLSSLLLVLERATGLFGQPAIAAAFFILMVLIYLTNIFIKSREFTISYFYQIFYFIFLLVSAAIVANGAYMIEIAKEGNANGVFWALAIFFITGLEVSRFAYYCSMRNFERLPSPRVHIAVEKGILLAIVFLAIAISFYVLVRYSSPYLLKIERNDFWTAVVPSSLGFVPSLIFQTFFLALSLYWMKDGGDKKLASVIVLSYLFITVFVLGQKMSFAITYTMILGFFIAAHKPDFKISWRVMLVSGLAGLSVLGLLIYSYVIIGRDADFILIRVALQSQLNWSVLDGPEFPWFSTVLASCYLGCQGFDSGADFMSYYYLPEAVYNHYTNTGTGLSGFFPALSIFSLGFPLALVAYMLTSFVMGILQAYLVNHIRRKNIIFSFLVFKIYFAVILFVYAGIQVIFNKPFWLAVLLCMAMLVLLKLFSKQDRGNGDAGFRKVHE